MSHHTHGWGFVGLFGGPIMGLIAQILTPFSLFWWGLMTISVIGFLLGVRILVGPGIKKLGSAINERGWFRSHRKQLNMQSITQDHFSSAVESASVPIIEIEKIVFDPNGRTEMYLDIEIKNPSTPTTIFDWEVSIFIPSVSKSERYSPRWLKFGVFQGPFGNIQTDDLSERPLETGARRSGRVGFTISGEPPQQRFGGAGTKFRLSAKDVHGNVIAADYTLSHDMRA